MKVLVTGGAGFVGSNLVDALISQGHSVAFIDNLSTGFLRNINQKAHWFNLDVREDISSLVPFQAEVVFHLAALPRIQPSFKRPYETIDVNCNGTVRVLDYALKHKSKLIYAGSSSFYAGPQKNPYAHSKAVGENHCLMYNRVYGLSVGIARFFNVYGKRHVGVGENANLIGIFEHQKFNGLPLTITGTGEKRRDFTSVNDIVSGLIAISKENHNGSVFNLGRGHNYSINEVAAMFKPEKIEYLPDRPGEAWETLADINTELDWLPKENLNDYINKFLINMNLIQER